MKKLIAKISIIALVAASVFVACEGIELEENPLLDQQTAIDNTLSEDAVTDVFGIVNEGTLSEDAVADVFAMFSNHNEQEFTKSAKCQQVVWDAAVRKITITFPEPGCSTNGAVRTGTITGQFSGTPQAGFEGKDYAPGIKLTITFDNYKVDGATMEGSIEISFNSFSAAEGANFTVKAIGNKMTYPNGDVQSWEGVKEIQWMKGYTTPNDPSDDEFLLDGNTSGTASNGVVYTMEIIESIHITNTCDKGFPVAGIMKITEDEAWAQLDFGTGACDTQAVYSSEGFEVTIDLATARN